MISILKDLERRIGWSVGARFEITLHLKDEDLLNQIKVYFKNAGKIYKYGKDKISYRVNNLEQIITIIIPHFEKYPLNTNKRGDFELFKSVVMMMQQKEHLTKEGLDKIVAIRASMNLGLSEVLKAAFINTIPISRSQFVISNNYHPQWVAGFTSGEGYFGIKILTSSTHKIGVQVKLIFQLTQHARDELLMKSFEDYFECGKYYPSKRGEYGDYQVGKLSHILEIIIPFFQNNKILGNKSKDFDDWCKVADLMKDNQHLNEKELEQIKIIKDGMNKVDLKLTFILKFIEYKLYQDFLHITREVSNRKTIYVFDSNTHELIEKLSSVSRALKYAKVNFYTLKSLIENGNSYEGKIYSYKDKL
uniref:hypothetical protein n=1 Tax=Drechslerella dactyloides TaxID=74499 RepID=UPI0022FD8CDA|nr:hypothetical protein PNX16_mgp055 [Drechslerella dactyloides]WAN89796.1 hypothetical protein [Drechslerella dactyloides]